MEPLGLRYFLAAQVFCSPSHQAVFAVHRSRTQGHVDSAAIEKIERLLPHLQQAMDLKFRLAAAEIKSRPDLESLERLNEGCVTVDRTGKTLFVNAAASEIIARSDGVDVVNGVISFSDTKAANRFGRLLEQLIDGKEVPAAVRQFPAKRPNGKRPYLIALRPLPQHSGFSPYADPAIASVFIRDPEDYAALNTVLLKQSYDLTKAETELAAALDRGFGLRDIADRRAVSINTVRTQLYALMAKLGVHRQTELIGLLARYHVPFG
jgi:DNA-binding CsgD family transcriptional regulator